MLGQDQHRALLEAIGAREGARAEALAREHARLARRNLGVVLERRELLQRIPGAALIRREPDEPDGGARAAAEEGGGKTGAAGARRVVAAGAGASAHKKRRGGATDAAEGVSELPPLRGAVARHIQGGDSVAREGFTHLTPFAAV